MEYKNFFTSLILSLLSVQKEDLDLTLSIIPNLSPQESQVAALKMLSIFAMNGYFLLGSMC